MKMNRASSRIFLVMTLVGSLSACGGSDTPSNFKLFINELQPSNQDIVRDENGEADDWIEIYNGGDSLADLKGYIVSDSGTSHTIPSSIPIPVSGFVLLWADDSPSEGPAHLAFKLSATAGDSVTLTDPDGKPVDTVSFGVAVGQYSYARFPDGIGPFVWCAAPTPKASNGPACALP
jgi:hypothetical protein